jgi:SNF2 family DNA or RNA helicase
VVRKGLQKNEIESDKFNVILTTFEYVMKDKHFLKKIKWQYIIVDEGHRMKNAQSKFAQTLGNVYESRNRLLLTGTPLQNNLPELWALLNFLLPTIFNSVENFEQWFNKPLSNLQGESQELNTEERMLIINRLHQVLRPFLLRRVKSSVMDQLPEKQEKVIRCNLSAWQKIVYKQLFERGTAIVNPVSGQPKRAGQNLSNIVMQLRKICNHPYLFLNNGYEDTVSEELVRCRYLLLF